MSIKQYLFKNPGTNNETVLELNLKSKKLSLLQYKGVEQNPPFVANLDKEKNQEMLLTLLDLFTEGDVLTKVTIGGI